jgi:hypothetical protein
MATCLYCEHRKGKRSCPALAGAICAACCGQHRLRDIDCPAGCVHLGGLTVAREAAPASFTKSDLGALWEKLYAYADRAREFRNEALPRVIEDLEPTAWERDLASGYLYYGHRDAGGHRLVDHFIAARGRDLPRGEMVAAVALRDAWASLFEVRSVHAGVGLELRDLRSGELHRVRELLATAQVQPGDVMFTWVMALADHLELTGIACTIPQQHRESVRAAIEAELAVTRTRWPGTPERELVGATAWVVAEAMRTAVLDEPARAPGPAAADAPRDAAYDASQAPAPPEAIPPLAHEVMYRLVLGFKEAIERAVEHTRRGGWKDTDILDPESLIKRSNIEEYLFPLGHALMASGWDKRSTVLELQLLSVHAFNVLSYQLHRRKTFWVDESLAFMLACTRLDVRGEGLRLPFPSFALVFTDREALGLAEALAARDDVATVRGRTLRALTVYVTQVPAARGALGLHLCLMLDAGIEQWPWIVTRDLDIAPDHTLDEILDSHFPGIVNDDPIFATGELRQLLGLIVNAILFATSSPSWPELTPPPRPPATSSTPRHRAIRHPEPERTGERVWHLPGKIPISQVRALRELRNSSEHGPMFSRFMVRGHWRRAPDTWRDRSARWIEPYWRGPELGDIVEREYRLKP